MTSFIIGVFAGLSAVLIMCLALTKKGYFKISFIFDDPINLVDEGDIFTLDLFQEKLLLILKEDFPGRNIEIRRGSRVFVDNKIIGGVLAKRQNTFLSERDYINEISEAVKIYLKAYA